MSTLFTVLHVIVCLFLMLTVLLQSGKGGGMGGAFGGGNSATVFGGSGASNFLVRLTAVAGTVFMFTSMLLAFLASHNSADELEKFGKDQAALSKEKEQAKDDALKTLGSGGSGSAGSAGSGIVMMGSAGSGLGSGVVMMGSAGSGAIMMGSAAGSAMGSAKAGSAAVVVPTHESMSVPTPAEANQPQTGQGPVDGTLGHLPTARPPTSPPSPPQSPAPSSTAPAAPVGSGAP
jgi:preprotein translocase subunit SecG